MATIDRAEGEEYSVTFGASNIAEIANAVKTVPDEYINDTADGITEAGINYLKPLIMGECEVVYDNGMPAHIVL
jgi:6-phosphofructokinase 1